MNVYLLRHGQAEANTSSDASRCLTNIGRKDIKSIAKSFQSTSLNIERCLVSPLTRTQETARLFENNANLLCEIEIENTLSPENKALDVFRFLDSFEQENVLLISHNPLLSELYALFTKGDATFPLKIMAPGELCAVSFDILGLGLGKEVLNLLPDKT